MTEAVVLPLQGKGTGGLITLGVAQGFVVSGFQPGDGGSLFRRPVGFE
jgi:hypothetical protein